VLELGAGMGEHSGALLRTGASVTCLDIAPAALAKLTHRFAGFPQPPSVIVGDIENLPFADGTFDVVASAGALSYGETDRIKNEIVRVLRPGGGYVCVDSLNNNLIYRFNRWRHYRLGQRSRSTLTRMPNLDKIRQLSEPFDTVELNFFGAMTWAVAAIAPVTGQKFAAALSDRIDDIVRVRGSAFKFVLVASGLNNRGG
jgi:SAM-dependent methyltransferase